MHPPAILLRNPRQAAALASAAAAALALAAYRVFGRRPTAEDLEARRRDHLARNGRVIDGSLIDAAPDLAHPDIVVYRYRIAGVTYECSQNVAGLGRTIELHALDLPIQVRYNRANPGDSIVLAETWDGLWSLPQPVK